MDRIAKLKEILRADPGDSFAQHALALEFIKIGDDTEARNLFESLLKNDPGYVGSYYHLGKLLERGGNTEEALTIYERGMEEAKRKGDGHAYGELKAVYEELKF